jgi:hypothetical protein
VRGFLVVLSSAQLLQDFFYVCPGHLKDRGFCSPIIDEAAVAAKKKKEMEAEVERVKQEFEEKQKKKKEKEKEKEKKKDKDKKDDDEKEEKKSEEKVGLLCCDLCLAARLMST